MFRAESMDEAISKVQKIARTAAKPYRGVFDGVPVKWEFVGITNVLPVYEPLEDGVEIIWEEHRAPKLKTLQSGSATKPVFVSDPENRR